MLLSATVVLAKSYMSSITMRTRANCTTRCTRRTSTTNIRDATGLITGNSYKDGTICQLCSGKGLRVRKGKRIGIASSFSCESTVVGAMAITSKVAKVNSEAFSSYEGVGEVSLPKALQDVKMETFKSATVAEVGLPSKLGDVNTCTFCRDGLVDLSMPGAIAGVSRCTFDCYGGLRSIDVPKDIGVLPRSLFRTSVGLGGIALKRNISEVRETTFQRYNLAKMDFPSDIAIVNRNTFSFYASLEGISLPGGLARVKGNMFDGYQGLKGVAMPTDIGGVEDRTFCSYLTVGGVAVLGDGAIVRGRTVNCGFGDKGGGAFIVTKGGNSATRACTGGGKFHFLGGATTMEATGVANIPGAGAVLHKGACAVRTIAIPCCDSRGVLFYSSSHEVTAMGSGNIMGNVGGKATAVAIRDNFGGLAYGVAIGWFGKC